MFYGIDAGVTYQAGLTVANLDTEVNTAKSQLVTALEAVTPGSLHGVGAVSTGIDTFKTWAVQTANSVANGVSNLGTNTANGASTSVETTNETTALYNGQGALNRGINTAAPTAV